MAELHPRLREQGVTLVVVHLGSVEKGRAFLARYGLGEVEQVSDPEARLYRAFGLRRVMPWAFLRWRTLARGAQLFPRFGVGSLEGDGLRMPGVFLLVRGEIVRAFRHEGAEEVPDYLALACGNEPVA